MSAPRWPGDTRPDFERGNLLSARSGAWSPRLVDETMAELRPDLEHVIAECPWVKPIDEHAVVDYLRDLARAERLERWLATHGDRYPDGDKRAGELRDRDLRELASLRRRCMDHRARLGLDPASRARTDLERHTGPDLAVLWADAEEADG